MHPCLFSKGVCVGASRTRLQMNPGILVRQLLALWSCVYWGSGMQGVLRGASPVGGQSRRTRPRWMSGQHLFHLLAGSYQQQRCHTHWMGGGGGGHSTQSLRKHAGFCLSSKQKLGPLSRSRVCISQSSEGSRCVSRPGRVCHDAAAVRAAQTKLALRCKGCNIWMDHQPAVAALTPPLKEMLK